MVSSARAASQANGSIVAATTADTVATDSNCAAAITRSPAMGAANPCSRSADYVGASTAASVNDIRAGR